MTDRDGTSAAVADLPMSQEKLDNYVSERGAHAYHSDHQRKLHRRLSDRRERRILTRFLAGRDPVDRLLDIPCGYGRFLEFLATRAKAVVEADYSPSMLALNASLHPDIAAEHVACSALDIPAADASFDTVVSIRLNHHLDRALDRELHLRELCRVSGATVIFSFFSSRSLKNRLRRLRSLWARKRPKNTLSPRTVRRVLGGCGFEVERMVPLARIGSGHVYVLARRVSCSAPEARRESEAPGGGSLAAV